MKRVSEFLIHLKENRYLVFQMTKRDVTMQYKRSRLGMLWSLAEPLAFMGVLFLVFGLGLRGGAHMDIPFLGYLVTGLAAMNFFTEVFGKGTGAVKGHAYLLTKVSIQPSVLSVVMVLTGLVHHLLFLAAALAILLGCGVWPRLSWIQVLYYMFSLSVFLFGLTLFTSSVGVFFNDLASIISVISRMLFYFTPIFWDIKNFSPRMQEILKLNPIFYIVQGYRDSFFYGTPFWEHYKQTAYFWAWTAGMLALGAFAYRKLRPQFADML